MSDDFYRAFEDRHRGSRDVILERLEAYRPFVLPLLEVYPDGEAVDLGCGRGEWLELLAREGFRALGVDLDGGMLEACRERGLPARQDDAVEFLGSLPDESQVIVSAFHFIEHIPFDQLRKVVSDAFRVLKPGGLLIMETPNPENIAVATRNFYLDPTHERPIPPDLLSFLPEYYGFDRSKIVRLQESRSMREREVPVLHDVFEGASPDYAVIAQKPGPRVVCERLDGAFAEDYGLSFGTLAARYDAGIAAAIREAELRAERAEANALQAEANARHSESQVQRATSMARRAADEAALAAGRARHAEIDARRAVEQLHAVYASQSWRITAPLRWAMLQGRLMRQHGPRARATAFLRRAGSFAIRRTNAWVAKKPGRRERLASIARKAGVHQALRNLHRRLRGVAGPGGHSPTSDGPDPVPVELRSMTSRARRIHADLQSTIESRKRSD